MRTLWILFEIGINIYQGWLYCFFLHRRLNQKPELSAKKAASIDALMIICVACFYSLYIWFDIPVTDSVVHCIRIIVGVGAADDHYAGGCAGDGAGQDAEGQDKRNHGFLHV